jgi:hypothetical protein
MTFPARFSQLGSEFDAFLFAPIGEEKSGMILSVASALARLGIDPWNESRRLAQMPSAKATDALASMIASLPWTQLSFADAAGIAVRLVALLPTGATDASYDAIAPAADQTILARRRVRLLCFMLILAALLYLGTDRKVNPHVQTLAFFGETIA